MGKAVALPTLLELVTVGYKKCQEKVSHALSERVFLRIYEAYKGKEHRYMLRQGTAAGATAFLQPAVAGLTDNHTAAAGRMKPHIFRMALRNMLGMEPIAGMHAMIQAGGGCCPSCNTRLDGILLNPWVVTQHLIGCSSGVFWNRNANAITSGVARCFADVGVKGKTEVGGLSATSAHRPGDYLSEPMTGPVEFDAGGSVRYVVDTTVNYVSPTSMRGYLSGDQRMNATQAEKAKESKIRREVEQGVRSPLRAGFTFVPAGITSRGVLGAGMERLLGMLAEYGAARALRRPQRHPCQFSYRSEALAAAM